MSERYKPASAHQSAEFVAATLRGAGHVALLAGGCVRDLLMGREPADYDVATDAVPARVNSLFRRTLLVGAQFGVVIVLLGRFRVEVATFRSESGYADGRRPSEVHFSDARQDALRRDFTINGMFLDPATGEVLDYVGGREDIAARRIQAIGQPDERFAEDHLRMLRAVRFACVLGFEIDAETERAIARHARLIGNVSAERIWQEWAKLLAHPNRATGWDISTRTGLAGQLWPALSGHHEAISSRLRALPPTADAVTALAAQFLSLKAANARQAAGQFFRPLEQVHEHCRALSLDNRSREVVAWLVSHATDLLDATLDVIALKKLMAGENWARLVELAGAIGANGSPDEQANLAANLAAAGRIDAAKVAPPPLIDGRDVMALGQPEGPQVGRVLAAIYDAQLADRIHTRAEALALAKRLLGHS